MPGFNVKSATAPARRWLAPAALALALAASAAAAQSPAPSDDAAKPAKTAKPATGPCAQFQGSSAEYRNCLDQVKADNDRRRLGDCANAPAGSIERERCLQARKQAARNQCAALKPATPERADCEAKAGKEPGK